VAKVVVEQKEVTAETRMDSPERVPVMPTQFEALKLWLLRVMLLRFLKTYGNV
jgi:hypothetical protein